MYVYVVGYFYVTCSKCQTFNWEIKFKYCISLKEVFVINILLSYNKV